MQLLRDGNMFSIINNADIIKEFPVGNYEVTEDMFGRILFEKVEDTIMPSKVYSNDTEFIAHVAHSWAETKGNIGICLVGKKGLGKSFTGNIIATDVGLPVIRVTKYINNDNLFRTLNSIDQDFVLFIDEFEKIFAKTNKDGDVSQQNFLTFLDGGTERKNKIMFIITANDEFAINEFLKNRPSRLKYLKQYDTLPDNIIREVVSDLLKYPEYKQDLLDNLPYDELNMDVLIQIINEMNMHNKPYSAFKEFFNFKASDFKSFNLYATVDDKEILVKENVRNTIYSYSHIARLPNKSWLISKETIELTDDRDTFNGYYNIPATNEEDEDREVPVTIRLEKVKNRMSDVVLAYDVA